MGLSLSWETLAVRGRLVGHNEYMGHLDEAEAIKQVLDGRMGKDGYDRVTVVAVGANLELRIHVLREAATFGLVIPGPHSAESQPWVYAEPRDIGDWASMLAIWLDENLTAGAGDLATERRDGLEYLIVAPYGLRRAGEAEHERLINLAPRGWF